MSSGTPKTAKGKDCKKCKKKNDGSYCHLHSSSPRKIPKSPKSKFPIKKLPDLALEEVLLNLDPAELKEICGRSRDAKRICDRPGFRRRYKDFHSSLLRGNITTIMEHSLYKSGWNKKDVPKKFREIMETEYDSEHFIYKDEAGNFAALEVNTEDNTTIFSAYYMNSKGILFLDFTNADMIVYPKSGSIEYKTFLKSIGPGWEKLKPRACTYNKNFYLLKEKEADFFMQNIMPKLTTITPFLRNVTYNVNF